MLFQEAIKLANTEIESVLEAFPEPLPPGPLKALSRSNIARIQDLHVRSLYPLTSRLGLQGKKMLDLDDILKVVETRRGYERWRKDKLKSRKPYERRTQKATRIMFGGLEAKTGKSFLARSLSIYLCLKGMRVLHIDYSMNRTNFIGSTNQKRELGEYLVYMIGEGDPLSADDLICKTELPGLDVISGGRAFTEYEKIATRRLVDFDNMKLMTKEEMATYWTMLSPLYGSVSDDYDVIILDTPSRQTFTTATALFEAQHVIVPTTLTRNGVLKTTAFLETARALVEADNERYPELEHYKKIRFLVSRNGMETQNPSEQAEEIAQRSEFFLTSRIPETDFIHEMAARNKTLFHELCPRVSAMQKQALRDDIEEISCVIEEITDGMRKDWRTGIIG